jgi:hypothetical protein
MNTPKTSNQIKNLPKDNPVDTLIFNKNVFDLFEDTLNDSISELLTQVADKYGEKYGFTAENLIDEFLPDDEILVSITTDTSADKQQSLKKNRRITKKSIQQKNSKDKTHKCIARTWSGGKGLQCTRYAIKNREFCRTHQNQIDREVFWQGTINDSDNKVAIIYKTNIEKKKAKKNKRNNLIA